MYVYNGQYAQKCLFYRLLPFQALSSPKPVSHTAALTKILYSNVFDIKLCSFPYQS